MTTQPGDLRDLIASVQIDDVRLVEGISKTTISAEQMVPGQLVIQHDAEVAATLPGRFTVRASLVARVVPQSVTSDDPPLGSEVMVFGAVHELTYLVPPNKTYSHETLTQFAKLNGVFNAWPYWRHFVQSATVDMGLPRIVMPVFRGDLGRSHRHALELTSPAKPDQAKSNAKPQTRTAGTARKKR